MESREDLEAIKFREGRDDELEDADMLIEVDADEGTNDGLDPSIVIARCCLA